MTTGETAPKPPRVVRPHIDADISWLLKQLEQSTTTSTSTDAAPLVVTFEIRRSEAKTPSRNEEVKAALEAGAKLESWARGLVSLATDAYRILTQSRDRPTTPSSTPPPRDEYDLGVISEDKMFVPCVPLFEDGTRPAETSAASAAETGATVAVASLPPSTVTLSSGDISALLTEQRRAQTALWAEIDASFPPPQPGNILSAAEAKLCAIGRHVADVIRMHTSSVKHVEGMLRAQLVSAIGKELAPSDFAAYMTHHEARLYADDFAPKPFCFAVRRDGRFPEGSVSIEVAGGAESSPVHTLRRTLGATVAAPMHFSLDAATTVEVHPPHTHIYAGPLTHRSLTLPACARQFGGERVVHALVAHTFKHAPPPSLVLAARARQFSAFMLLLGRLGPGGDSRTVRMGWSCRERAVAV